MNRFVGAYGRGVSVLVTGDDTLPLSKAMASYQHRDYDAARGNTLVCILALNDDCMRFAKSRSDLKEGEDDFWIEKVKKGQIIMFTTPTYHAGCAMEDLNGFKEDKPRRRLFTYWDIPPAVKDKTGAVLGPSEAPIPPHYEVTRFGDLPSVNVAFHVACSQANKYDGPGLIGVNLKCQQTMIY